MLVLGQTAMALLYACSATKSYLAPEQSTTLTTPTLLLLAISDACIAISLSAAFMHCRIGIPKLDSLLNFLTIYTLSNGLLITGFTIVVLICFIVRPDRWWWIAVFFVEERLYVCSLMVSLNLRPTSKTAKTEDVQHEKQRDDTFYDWEDYESSHVSTAQDRDVPTVSIVQDNSQAV